MPHAGDHVIMRVWCVRLNAHMQMSATAVPACKGGMCCVLEAHMVQIVYMITVAGCLHQRREQMDGADAAQRPAGMGAWASMFSMFGEGYILCFCGVVLLAAPAVDCR